MPAMKTTPAHIRFLFGNLRHWNAQWPAEEREFAAGCAVVAAVRNIECPLILTILRLRSENTSNRRNPCDEVGALDTRVPGSSRSRRLSGHWLGKGHSQGSCLFLNSSTSPRTMCRERWAVLRHCLGLTETGAGRGGFRLVACRPGSYLGSMPETPRASGSRSSPRQPLH